jgi:hypothetical protein
MATASSAARRTVAAANEIHKYFPGILRIPREAHTLAGFRDWVHSHEFPEKLKVMFLEGEVFLDMSEEDIRSHAAVKTAVCVALEIFNQEMVAISAVPTMLPTYENTGSSMRAA